MWCSCVSINPCLHGIKHRYKFTFPDVALSFLKFLRLGIFGEVCSQSFPLKIQKPLNLLMSSTEVNKSAA